MHLYYENTSTISIAHNPVQQKDIELNKHSIKEKLNNRLICTSYMCINSQPKNVLTKSVSNPTFQTLIGKLGIDNIYSSA